MKNCKETECEHYYETDKPCSYIGELCFKPKSNSSKRQMQRRVRNASGVASGELKPCPFCGEIPEYFFGEAVNQIFCDSNKCIIKPKTPYYDNKKTTIDVWNKRV